MDPRELIMARLDAICSGLAGITVYRNRPMSAEDAKPAIVIMEGDELADDGDRNRHGLAPRRVTMTPSLFLLVSEQPEAVGSALSELRARVLYAVLSDSPLAAITADNRGAAYMGATVAMDNGRRIEGALEMTFALTYIMRPADLAAAGSSGS